MDIAEQTQPKLSITETNTITVPAAREQTVSHEQVTKYSTPGTVEEIYVTEEKSDEAVLVAAQAQSQTEQNDISEPKTEAELQLQPAEIAELLPDRQNPIETSQAETSISTMLNESIYDPDMAAANSIHEQAQQVIRDAEYIALAAVHAAGLDQDIPEDPAADLTLEQTQLENDDLRVAALAELSAADNPALGMLLAQQEQAEELPQAVTFTDILAAGLTPKEPQETLAYTLEIDAGDPGSLEAAAPERAFAPEKHDIICRDIGAYILINLPKIKAPPDVQVTFIENVDVEDEGYTQLRNFGDTATETPVTESLPLTHTEITDLLPADEIKEGSVPVAEAGTTLELQIKHHVTEQIQALDPVQAEAARAIVAEAEATAKLINQLQKENQPDEEVMQIKQQLEELSVKLFKNLGIEYTEASLNIFINSLQFEERLLLPWPVQKIFNEDGTHEYKTSVHNLPSDLVRFIRNKISPLAALGRCATNHLEGLRALTP
ncbi:hypothetical protein BH23PAT1_BH23PAT1_2290 [soil metagenome]